MLWHYLTKVVWSLPKHFEKVLLAGERERECGNEARCERVSYTLGIGARLSHTRVAPWAI